jgi:hypothetical protein
MRIGLPGWLLALVVSQETAEQIQQRTKVTGKSRRRYSLLGGLLTVDLVCETANDPEANPNDGEG